jgi:hypothetical protein
MNWNEKRQIADGVWITQNDPTIYQLVGQLHKILWPMERADHMKMKPAQVWEECMAEVRRLKGHV